MFSVKTVRITIQLRKGEFDNGGNTVIIEGLPVSVTVTKQGGEAKNKASVTVDNLKLETATQLTTLAFKRLETYNNVIQIDAGSQGAELSTIFIGEITSAVPVMSDSKLSLKIEALAGYYPALIPSTPTSVQENTTVEKLMKQFADEAGYSFENKGITASIENSVFIGSPVEKAKTLARQADVDLLIDDNKFTIQPFEAPKDGQIPLLSKNTGLIGYPSFSNEGINCKSVFNDKLKVGSYFKLESILPHASGEWQITKVEHRLEAYTPNSGTWESDVTGVLPGGNTNGG